LKLQTKARKEDCLQVGASATFSMGMPAKNIGALLPWSCLQALGTHGGLQTGTVPASLEIFLYI